MEFKIENGILMSVRGLDFNLNFNEIIPTEVTKIGPRAFYKCPYFSEIIIPDWIEEIDDEAFEGCILLKKIVLPQSVKRVGKRAFSECINLESISFDKNTYFDIDCFLKDGNIKEMNCSGDIKKLFYFGENNQYAITKFNPELSTDEYSVYMGKFISILFFPRENIDELSMAQYFVTIKKDGKEYFWFGPDMEMAKLGAMWAASGKGAADFFGAPFADDSVLRVEEFSLLMGVCLSGKKLWDFLGAVYNKPEDTHTIGDIKMVLYEEWPEMGDRFNTLLEKQYENFNYLNMESMIPYEKFVEKLKEILKKYKVSRITQ